MNQHIRKAVIPAAGLGTRFLPATKSIPKEMLPLVDKPLIQYAVEEAVAAGCTQIVIVTSRGKGTIENHFDRAPELERALAVRGATERLSTIDSLLNRAHISYVRQPTALGLGHAVLMAKEVIGDEPFAVILPDDIVDCSVPCLKQMTDAFDHLGRSLLACEIVEGPDIQNYGCLACSPLEHDRRLSKVSDLIEKPGLDEAPSKYAIIGRYILRPGIFRCLEALSPGSGGELQLTDAIRGLLATEEVFGFSYDGVRHDAGDKLSFLKANISFGSRHPEFGAALRDWMRQYLLMS